MITISHDFFSHIIDLIWQQLDYEGQLAARAACKNWMNRADSRLNHIVISCFERPDIPHVFDLSTRDLRKSFSSRAWRGQMSHRHGKHEHGIECRCDESEICGKSSYTSGEKLALDLERTLLSSTEVVDFVGMEFDWPHVPLHMIENTLVATILLDSRFTAFTYRRLHVHRQAGRALHRPLPVGVGHALRHSSVNYLCLSDPNSCVPWWSPMWNEQTDTDLCPVVVILRNNIALEIELRSGWTLVSLPSTGLWFTEVAMFLSLAWNSS